MRSVAVFLALVAGANAECPNACSGNGVCSAYDMCTCYRNFQGESVTRGPRPIQRSKFPDVSFPFFPSAPDPTPTLCAQQRTLLVRTTAPTTRTTAT